MAEYQSWNKIEDQKDALEAIKKIKRLQELQRFPDRNGMISALSDAKETAFWEITALELSQENTRWMPFSDFSNDELKWKLGQYEQGLINYCVEKIGKQLFDELMKK